MSDFNIDDVLSRFDGKAAALAKSNSAINVDEILKDFHIDEKGRDEPLPSNLKKVYIDTGPKPPISGATAEQSAEINSQPSQPAGPNPRELLPKTSIQESAYNADLAGKNLMSSGIEDLSSGHPYKGAAKVVGGGIARVMSPATGIVEGAVGTPITDLTGNPDIGDRAAFVAGSALPVVPGSNYVAKVLPKSKAFNNLVKNIGEENLPAVVSAMKADPRIAPVDLSPRVLQDAQHLFVNDGPQIQHLADTSAGRIAGSKAAVEGAMDSSLGKTVNALDKLKELKANIREVGSKEINPIVSGKPHTDVTDIIHGIDKDIGKVELKALREGKNHPLLNDAKKELFEVRNKLRGDWKDRDQMFAYTDQVHEIQTKLREKADALSKSSSGSERLLSKTLYEVREKLKDAVGPEYKAALGKYKDEIDIQDAFHHGHDSIIKTSRTIESRPEFFKDWVKNASKEELEAAREGARVAIDTQINGFKHAARRGTDVGEVEFSKQRIEALFGKQEAGKLFERLKNERAIANTHNKIVEGSQTAMRSASKEQFALPTKHEVGQNLIAGSILETGNILAHGYPGVGSAILTAAHAGNAVKHAASTALARKHNLEYAKYALPTQGPDREALIKALEARIPGPKPSLLNKARLALPVGNP